MYNTYTCTCIIIIFLLSANLQQLPNVMSSPSPSLTVPDFGSVPFSSGLSPSPTNAHTQLGLPPPAKKFRGRFNKNKDPIIIKNMQDSWVVPGISSGGQQVPSFSQFSPSNLHSMMQQSPSPYATNSMPGIGNENVTLSGPELIPSGMGFPALGGENPAIATDSPTHSDIDMRLGSIGSSGASISGSIQDLSLSASSVVGHHHHVAGHLTATDSIQSLDNLSSLPPPSLPLSDFVTGSTALPVQTTPTTSGHLQGDNMAATSLIAKPPSMLNDPNDLQLARSSSSLVGSHGPSLLDVHEVETLPNSFNAPPTSDCYIPSSSQQHPSFPQPHPLPTNGSALPGVPFPQSSSSYHYLNGNIAQGISLPISHSSSYYAAPPYHQQFHPISSSKDGSTAFVSPNTLSKTNAPPTSVPAIHVDSELARIDEYMQHYLSESHSQESLKNGTSTAAILNATKEHDKLISQVLLMSPKRNNDIDRRRSSGATAAVFLSMLEDTGTNDRGSPFITAAAAQSELALELRQMDKETTDGLTSTGSPQQQRHTTFPGRSTSLSSSSVTTSRHPNSTSTATTPSSEASPLLSHCQTSLHDHQRENNSDTSSGVSSASTKFSRMSCSSGQSSPLGFASPTALNSPSVSPSPSSLEDYSPLDKNDRNRTESRGSCSSPDGLLNQIYEPYPDLSNDEGEYMIENPDLRPPPPPRVKGKIDLNPKVPIYEVRKEREIYIYI